MKSARPTKGEARWKLDPSAVYAVTVVRAEGQTEIHCAFTSEADAIPQLR